MTYHILNDDNEIAIPPALWDEMNAAMDKDEIKQLLSDTIEQSNVPLPMRKITLDDAKDGFAELVANNHRPVDGKWFTRYEYSEKYPLTDMYFPSIRKGNAASDYFHQTNRWKCDSINSPSPHRTWTTEKFRLTLFNALWSLKMKEINATTLRSTIGLRKYIASQFRPATAKAVYEYFSARDVLDFSSGWGDRLAGFLASDSGMSYTGIDPNLRLVDGYNAQVDTFNKHKSVEFFHECAEDVDLGDRMFDTIFTSPPYFNIERYTQEDNQSFKRYRKINDWNEQFLHKTLGSVWNHLKDGGVMIINISDVYSNHTINRICDDMNNYLSTLPDSIYAGCVGYQMMKRPNSGALKNKEGVFAEPMWVWTKAL
jgi:hypothetical protein